ncbi:MAG TPA: short-chain fatty acyl-CoA regulator family protein [Phenylobacterium sp.]|jgi:predicted transcriptional regulator/transcriptional regulator with XRE-family HTH domain|uniref:helix-turn-helix domain-containing protein n=1 Tax=Phenylobacterium sp. TaxID=1871053 RepID=UPI002CA04078|nr:short-chain fatty acyl-CoA regulator family protein [Phenylobacterium sp.]HXA40679.1 short-chain fatty acyl-CoA regulator family protein [Phenylobacterium sp.]
MAMERGLYVGPRLRRMRRDLGLTQADMAAALEVSASYIALLERNNRPLTAGLLLKLAQTYDIDVTALGSGAAEDTARLQGVLKDPIFAGLEWAPNDLTDMATNYPGITEAMLRLYTTYQEGQLAFADREAGTRGDEADDAADPVADSRRFLAARRNSFPTLDDAAERLAQAVGARENFAGYLRERHDLKVRRVPPSFMVGSTRRLDRHRQEILLDDSLDAASQAFQLALQLCYLELGEEIGAVLAGGSFASESGERLTRRALASYAAAAVLMPYSAFARAVEARRYDVEALARQFGCSFEQTAHRLTTLQKPGQERVPFFFIRVDPAGNVSKRLDGAGFPFARHGGGCPLWSVHHAFRTPREIVTQWLELPDGQRFFSIARTVTAGGGAFGAPRVERAIALGCAAEHASKLIYAADPAAPGPDTATPIGVTCRLCQRTECTARSEPPIGRLILPDDIRRTSLPFGFSDS